MDFTRVPPWDFTFTSVLYSFIIAFSLSHTKTNQFKATMSPNAFISLCIIYLIELIHLHTFANGRTMTSEPDLKWNHVESPSELEEEIRILRQNFDDWIGLSYGNSCVTNTDLYTSYDKINAVLHAVKDVHNVDSKYDMLDDFDLVSHQDKLNTEKSSGPSICSITKGMSCISNKCNCTDLKDFNPPPPPSHNINVIYDKEVGACVLKRGTHCNADWETKCSSPSRCVMEQNKNQPETNLECTSFNLEKYNLFKIDGGSWNCTCMEVDHKDRVQAVKSLLNKLLSLSEIQHGDTCDVSIENAFVKLENSLLSMQDINSFYKEDYKTLVPDLDEKLTGDAKLCSKNPKALLECNSSGKCACKYESDFNPRSGCKLKSGSSCDENGLPYPCQNGQQCIFTFRNVLCTSQNVKQLSKFDGISKILKECKCSATSSTTQMKFTTNDLADLELEIKKEIAEKVHVEYHSSKWTILEKGADCLWEVDREYFQLSDYIRAGLEHVYYKTRYFEIVQNMEADMKKVCKLSASMRCDFVQQKCDCPTDGYLSEEIPSVYDTSTDRCMLKKGSLCHPTLTEWIHCQDGEVCLYQEVPILCNRENRGKIVKNGMRFKSGKCFCSSKEVQEIDKALVKKFKKTERTEF